jgi:hypothetical protein
MKLFRTHRPPALPTSVRSIGWGAVAVVAVTVAIALTGQLVAAAAHRNARTALPLLGTDGKGVSVNFRHGPTFVYSVAAARRYAKIAGRKVSLSCDRVTRPTGAGLLLDDGGVSVNMIAPGTRAPLAMLYRTPADFCAVALLRPAGREQVMAVVPVTSKGLDFLDQEGAARNINTVWAYPGKVRQALSLVHGTWLSSPNAEPPEGVLGGYQRGIYELVEERDHAGVRLFIEVHGSVTRTNLLGYLLEPPDDRGPYVGQTRSVNSQ